MNLPEYFCFIPYMTQIYDINDYVKGNNAALSYFYRQWRAELFLVAYHYLRNNQDAEDAIGDCFEKLMEMSIDYRHEKFINQQVDLKAFILVMLRNKCLDHIKSKNNRRRIQNNIAHHFSNSSSGADENILNKESIKSICEVLPNNEGRILMLHYNGYSHEEIAKNLLISEKTVKNKISLARNKLKILWQDFML